MRLLLALTWAAGALATLRCLTSGTPSASAGVAVDAAGGAVWFSDSTTCSVTRLDLGSLAVAVAAGGVCGAAADGTGTSARFAVPAGLAVGSSAGVVYVADSGAHALRQLSPQPGGAYAVSTLAGSGAAVYADGVGTAASFTGPVSLAYDGATLYIADGCRVAAVAVSSRRVRSLAGSAACGAADGAGTAASFSQPAGLALWAGLLYVADGGSGRVRVVNTSSGAVTTRSAQLAAGLAGVAATSAGVYATDGAGLHLLQPGGGSALIDAGAAGATALSSDGYGQLWVAGGAACLRQWAAPPAFDIRLDALANASLPAIPTDYVALSWPSSNSMLWNWTSNSSSPLVAMLSYLQRFSRGSGPGPNVRLGLNIYNGAVPWSWWRNIWYGLATVPQFNGSIIYGLWTFGNATNVTVAAALDARARLGASLEAFELGNEPDCWDRSAGGALETASMCWTAGWTGADYDALVTATAAALTAAGAVSAGRPAIRGPAVCSSLTTPPGWNESWFQAYVALFSPLLRSTVTHFYAPGSPSTAPLPYPPPLLASGARAAELAGIRAHAADSAAAGLPYHLGECGCYECYGAYFVLPPPRLCTLTPGGTLNSGPTSAHGVFDSALWAFDMMLDAASVGVGRWNMFSTASPPAALLSPAINPGGWDTEVIFYDATTGTPHVGPVWYAMGAYGAPTRLCPSSRPRSRLRGRGRQQQPPALRLRRRRGRPRARLGAAGRERRRPGGALQP